MILRVGTNEEYDRVYGNGRRAPKSDLAKSAIVGGESYDPEGKDPLHDMSLWSSSNALSLRVCDPIGNERVHISLNYGGGQWPSV